MSTMTLEQVRDRLREEVSALMQEERTVVTIHRTYLAAWADAIDAHLAQPAQAVDVDCYLPGITGGMVLLRKEYREGFVRYEDYVRALTGEKAGPAGDGVCDERKEYHDGSGYLQVAFADGVPELLGRSVRVSPASPAPDKEGQS